MTQNGVKDTLFHFLATPPPDSQESPLSSQLFTSRGWNPVCPEGREVSRKWLLNGCACRRCAKWPERQKVVLSRDSSHRPTVKRVFRLLPSASAPSAYMAHFDLALSKHCLFLTRSLLRARVVILEEPGQLWAEYSRGSTLPRLWKASEPRLSSL